MSKMTQWSELDKKQKQKRILFLSLAILIVIAIIVTTVCLLLLSPEPPAKVYERQLSREEMTSVLDAKGLSLKYPRETTEQGSSVKYFVGSNKGWEKDDALSDENIDISYYRMQILLSNQATFDTDLFLLNIYGYAADGAEYAAADGSLSAGLSGGIREVTEKSGTVLRLTLVKDGKRYEAVGHASENVALSDAEISFLRSKLSPYLEELV